MSVNLLKRIKTAYFGQLSFDRWKDAYWTWDLELIVPGGGGVQWGEFREYFRWPNQSRTEFDFKDGKILNFFDGEMAWEGSVNPRPIDKERFLLSIRLRHLVHDLVTSKVRVLKSDEAKGSFSLDYGKEDQPSVTFNPATGFLLKYEGPSKAMGRPNVSTFEWTDYEIQGGVPLAKKHNLLLNGVVFQRRTLKNFQMNPSFVVVSAAVILKDKSVLLTRRRKDDYLGGLWEFPGGKIHDGESLESCLRRELKEELGVATRVNRLYFSTTHEYPQKKVHLNFFLCDIISGIPNPQAAEELAWVDVKNLSDYELPPADKELVEKLQREFH